MVESVVKRRPSSLQRARGNGQSYGDRQVLDVQHTGEDMKAVTIWIALLFVLLSGCDTGYFDKTSELELKEGERLDPETGNTYSEDLLLVLPDGCRIKEIQYKRKINGYTYTTKLTTCPGTISWQCGKSTCTNNTVIEPAKESTK